MGQPRRVHKDIPQISTDRKAARKEQLQALLKLTQEITSTFNKEKGGICRKPLNGFPDPPRRPYAKSVPTTTLDGLSGLRKRQLLQSQNRRVQQQQVFSRGPALNPTNACYEMTNLCNKLETESGRYFLPLEDCRCSGCTGPCSRAGPHPHKKNTTCRRDYCNNPGFKPPIAATTGNLWSGEIQTYCNYPYPCKADCFDHRPPGDFKDPLGL